MKGKDEIGIGIGLGIAAAFQHVCIYDTHFTLTHGYPRLSLFSQGNSLYFSALTDQPTWDNREEYKYYSYTVTNDVRMNIKNVLNVEELEWVSVRHKLFTSSNNNSWKHMHPRRIIHCFFVVHNPPNKNVTVGVWRYWINMNMRNTKYVFIMEMKWKEIRFITKFSFVFS